MLFIEISLGVSAEFSLISSTGTASVFVISSAGSNVADSSWIGAFYTFPNAVAFFHFWSIFRSILFQRNFIYLVRNLLYRIFLFFSNVLRLKEAISLLSIFLIFPNLFAVSAAPFSFTSSSEPFLVSFVSSSYFSASGFASLRNPGLFLVMVPV